MDIQLLLSVIGGITILLSLILIFRLPAFISLLIASISAGLFAGLNGDEIIKTVITGMGSTLGTVATIVGLGAMFGAILEKSGGAQSIANYLVKTFGIKNAPTSMVITGFLVAIPVFFDVAFIILVPLLYALQKRTQKSLLIYAIPLLAGLAITHAFIPPTPGPIAVAEIMNASLGWVIIFGVLAGIPTAIVSGIFFGRYIGRQIHISSPALAISEEEAVSIPPVGAILTIITLPIFLILLKTFIESGIFTIGENIFLKAITLVGHPIVALIIANLVAWYALGIGRGFSAKSLMEISNKSFAPAGTIILLTGAGGVFKQVLMDTHAGAMIAEKLSDLGMPVIFFAFLAAALIRVIQGSATVAMITSAGLVAAIILPDTFTMPQLAAIVIAIASGGTMLSHVNDSGFWLVKEYLGMTEKQTFLSWTMMTAIVAITGFAFSLLLFYIF